MLGISGGQAIAVLEAFVVTLVTLVIGDGFDLSLQITMQEAVFQQNAVLEGLMPMLH